MRWDDEALGRESTDAPEHIGSDRASNGLSLNQPLAMGSRARSAFRCVRVFRGPFEVRVEIWDLAAFREIANFAR